MEIRLKSAALLLLFCMMAFNACKGGSSGSISSGTAFSTYTVGYDKNGANSGDVPADSFSYTEGEIVRVPDNTGELAKDGYAFYGWSTEESGAGAVLKAGQIFCMGNTNVTLYAQWGKNYTVTYNGNGNTDGSVPVDSNCYADGATVTVPGNTGNLAKSGYAFNNWNTRADGTGASLKELQTFCMKDAGITLYAQWKKGFTVTYSGNGNTGGSVPIDGSYYMEGQLLGVLANNSTDMLVKTGYLFYCWNTRSDGSGTNFYPGSSGFHMGNENVTLYAQWRKTYTVTYDGNGADSGTVPADKYGPYVEDRSVDLLWQDSQNPLVKGGYVFYGWSTNPDGTEPMLGTGSIFYTGNANITLYAAWIQTIDGIAQLDGTPHSVVYNGNGADSGSVPTDSGTYKQNDSVPLSGNTGSLVKAGYIFGGWNTAADGSGITFLANGSNGIFRMGTAGITLYARWDAATTYTVAYNGNGSTGGSLPADSNTYLQYKQVFIEENTGNLQKTGFAFDGWNTETDGSGLTFITTSLEEDCFFMGLSDIVLYAKWKDATVTHTVTYDGNGNTAGSAPIDGIAYLEDAAVQVPGNTGNLEKSGFVFDGWNTENDGKGADFTEGNSFLMGSSNVTLYAKWRDAATIHNVTYDGNLADSGIAPADANTYVEGAAVSVQANAGSLVKNGYILYGWSTRKDGGGIAYHTGPAFVMGNADIKLYAVWKINSDTHSAGEKAAFIGDGAGFTMVYVPGGLSCPKGVADESVAFVKNAYWIADTELTYEIYKKVYVWASGDANVDGIINGNEKQGAYTFANYGYQGIDDLYILSLLGYVPTTTNQHAVDNISWRDAMIFCNALTEWYNEKNGTAYACVYTSDSAFTKPLRAVNDSSAVSTSAGTQDNPYANPDAGGFRLLTADEWELAARYTDGDQWLYGDHVSGDTSGPVFAPGGYGLGGQAASVISYEYAVFSYTGASVDNAAVKSKKPNSLGLYDMSGNMDEICFDWDESGVSRIHRGGNSAEGQMNMQVGYITSGYGPGFPLDLAGIRLGRSAK